MNLMKAMFKKAAIATVCLSAAFSATASQSSAIDNLQLKTSVEDVNGVREIETGDYQHGITRTLAALEKTTVPALRAPLLNNLCVAHIALGQSEEAEAACNEAVNAGSRNALAFNNRAILNYLRNDSKACVEDMEKAQALGRYNRVIQKNAEFIAQQNLLAKN